MSSGSHALADTASSFTSQLFFIKVHTDPRNSYFTLIPPGISSIISKTAHVKKRYMIQPKYLADYLVRLRFIWRVYRRPKRQTGDIHNTKHILA
jgi:hypothetical protein